MLLLKANKNNHILRDKISKKKEKGGQEYFWGWF